MRQPKLKGQRLGQVVWNAIAISIVGKDDEYSVNWLSRAVGEKLFYIEDEDLVKLINDYLKEQ